MSHLSLYLLGPPRIEHDGLSVRVDTRKAIALLAYIAITGESHRRESLINLLWPEYDQTRGRANLRRTLYALRKALAGDWLDADRDGVRLDPGADIWLDVDQFHGHIAECLAHGHPASEVCPACVAPLIAATALYRDDFMSGFSLSDSLNFDDWQFFQAEALRQELATVLERLVRAHSAQGRFESGSVYAKRWLALDRMNEAAHRQLMQLYAWSGQRTAALRQYQECAQVLKEQLGIAPGESTTALHRAILESRLPRPPLDPTGPERLSAAATSPPAADLSEAPPRTAGAPAARGEMIGALLGNRYRLQARLGRGSLGVVYRARDTLLEREVAVKVLSAQAMDTEARVRLFQEARAAAQLNHPNIVAVYDVGGMGEPDSPAFIVLEMVDGEALHRRRPQTLAETLSIARQVCLALEQAHAHGIIHRDLKPENVLLTSDGTAKLMDFGLARTAASRITQEGFVVGTVYYLAPEQALGEELDGRADLYALGVMLYELTTGRLPFTGPNLQAIVSQHLHAPVVPPRTHNAALPPALDALILQLLSKRPDDRPASAAEVLQALERLESPGAPATAERVAAPSPPLGREREPVAAPESVFVAREAELGRLSRTLEAALAGHGQVLFVTGGPGRGKTALIQEFARRAHGRWPDLIFAGGNCNAHTGFGDPYLPFREIMGLLTGDVDALWEAGAISRDHARRLWDAFPLLMEALVESGPDLIDTFVPGAALQRRAVAYTAGGISARVAWLERLPELVAHKAALPFDPNLGQSALFEQYARVMVGLSRQRPLLLALDDLQWADAGSVALLFHLGRRLAGSRILIVGAYRPEEVAIGRPVARQARPGLPDTASGPRERHPLQAVLHEFQRKFGDITIDLTRAEARSFVEQYLDSEPNRLSAGFRETLYRQTAGHPLFTIELLRGMQERGDLVQDEEGRWVEGPALDWERLPARVEAVIAERVDRLDAISQAALRVASVEGEVFTAEVVARVRSTDAREVIACLSGELEGRHRLVRAQEIQRLGARRLSRYRFRHIQFQNYLYHSLDPVERAHLHEAVGTALEELYGEESDEIALPLARHFQEAGIAEKGIAYLLKAGQRAQRGSAHEAAIAHLTQGLELLQTLPESPERARRELELQIALGVPLVLTRGHVAPEVEALYTRARALCEGVGEAPQLFQVLLGLRRYYLHRAELETARELGEQLLTLSRGIQDRMYLSRAHMMQGEVLYRIGAFPQAYEHYEQAIALYDPQQGRSHLLLYGNDTGVLSQVFQAVALWQLGDPDQALRMSLEGLSRARELAHPFTLVCALYFAAVVHHFRGEVPAVQELTEELLRISRQRGFALYRAWGTVLRGWALARQGELEQGVAQVQQGLEEWRGMGAQLLLPQFLALLAEAHATMGQVEEGLSLLAQALERAEKNGERSWEAELHRLQGELSLLGCAPQAAARAEASFQRALGAARRQDARSWELRAATSLGRLWQKQGKGVAARDLLQEVYDGVSEGFETADLQQARALLDALA